MWVGPVIEFGFIVPTVNRIICPGIAEGQVLAIEVTVISRTRVLQFGLFTAETFIGPVLGILSQIWVPPQIVRTMQVSFFIVSFQNFFIPIA